MRAKFSALKISIEGSEYEATWVIISNSKLYGGKFLLAPDTDLSKPGFSVVLFQGKNAFGILLDLWEVFIGRAGHSRRIKIIKGTEISVTGESSEPIQADGDLAGCLPAVISSLPYSLNLIVPNR